jgi:elongation factor Ts
MDYKPTPEEIKVIRERTNAGIMAVKEALMKAAGDVEKTLRDLTDQGTARAETVKDRVTGEGQIGIYKHHNGRVGAMVKVECESDFVARSEEFTQFCQQLAQQVAAGMEDPLLDQDWLYGEGSVEDARAELSSRVGENIVIAATERFSL